LNVNQELRGELSEKPFMFNHMVEDPKALLKTLHEEGGQVVGEIEEYDYGKFRWIMDPEGNKIELWEPVNEKSVG
jgi:predicted enzyme related to lactoylglutathione lyase